MKQVLLNIAINACEAMPGGGTLSFAAARGEAGDVVFTIGDTGSGIPKENMSKLFTPFFTTKQIGKGTGLGLPIAYGIVKMHRGSITVRSDMGKGTTFIIAIPPDVRDLHTGPMTPLELASALSSTASASRL
jgi:signal transduction histidine kinase